MNDVFFDHYDKILDFYITAIEKAMPDFAETKNDYQKALETLKKNHPENVAMIDQLHTLLNQRITMDILYEMNLGYQDNLNYFKDPLNHNFLEKDWDRFLREKRKLAMTRRAETAQKFDSIFAKPFIHESDQSDFIIEYVSYLDTIIPKLAHFKGFLLANDLLYYTEPGYYADSFLTKRYERMIHEYFTTDFFE